jgi:cytolysin-activating lysine-acyltransferase
MAEPNALNGASPAISLDENAKPASPSKANVPQPDAVLGHVVWLMMNMPQYRHVFLTDLEWMVLPPIMLGQYRLFRAENRVVAFAAWAYLSEAVEARLQTANPRLAPSEWKSGDRLWLVDLHAPFGHQELALKELRETALKDRTFKMHRWTQHGRQTVEMIPERASSIPGLY